MDPVAMSQSALGILAQYKEQLDKAQLVFENAKQLLRLSYIFGYYKHTNLFF